MSEEKYSFNVTVKDAKVSKVSNRGNVASTYISGLRFVAIASEKHGDKVLKALIAAPGKQVKEIDAYVSTPKKDSKGHYYPVAATITNIVFKDNQDSAPEQKNSQQVSQEKQFVSNDQPVAPAVYD